MNFYRFVTITMFCERFNRGDLACCVRVEGAIMRHGEPAVADECSDQCRRLVAGDGRRSCRHGRWQLPDVRGRRRV